MNSVLARSVLLMTLGAGAVFPAPAAEEFNPVRRAPRASADELTLAVIVKFRKDARGAVLAKATSSPDRLVTLGKRSAVSMTFKREISPAMLAGVVELGDTPAEDALARLRAQPDVEYVAIDHRRFPHATQPNDSMFSGQWYLQSTEVSAVNAVDAWDRELGSRGVVIAVLDTGVLYDHPDLGRGDRGGKLLPGYDFVSADHMSNDGDGRDANPSDPGDWVDSSEKSNPVYSKCDVTTSSWHGTRVAGMIGALTNNGSGVAGLDWNSYLLPVRVLGKCGGNDSDILAGIRWAAGLPVAGVPANPTPARILNASFGSSGVCEPSYRDVIEELAARKVLLVISAGNDGSVVSSPANCAGVASVAAIRHAGSKVGFSNLGPEVTVAAPGGNCVNINGGPCLFSLDTTSNTGTTVPNTHTFTDQFNSNLGTSFSAPIVSGIAALMVSRNGNLSTTELLERLREGSRPFPTSVAGEPGLPTCHIPLNDTDFQLSQCLCTTTTCGAGMINAAMAVETADRPIAAVALPASVSAGQNVALDASGSAAACNRSVASYSWLLLSPGGGAPVVVSTTATASVVAPATGSITLRLTVTDDQNRSDSADVVLEPSRASTTAPATAGTTACLPAVTSGTTPFSPVPNPNPVPPTNPGSGGGGGGGLDPLTLTLAVTLLVLTLLARSRRRRDFARCN